MTHPFHFTGYMYFYFQNSALSWIAAKKLFVQQPCCHCWTIPYNLKWSGLLYCHAHFLSLHHNYELAHTGEMENKTGKKEEKCRSVVMCSGQLVFALPGWVYGTVSTSPLYTHTYTCRQWAVSYALLFAVNIDVVDEP